MGHQYLYDSEELRRRLTEADFTQIVDAEHGRNENPDLRERESRQDSSLICEARSS